MTPSARGSIASWIFRTDPDFAAKDGRILDLYEGRWEGKLLHPGDCVISADEKPSIQARRWIHETLPPAAGVARGQRVEHTYARGGALSYLAAWDVRRGQVFGRSERSGRTSASARSWPPSWPSAVSRDGCLSRSFSPRTAAASTGQ